MEVESFLHSWFLEETMAYQPSREVLQILVDMNCRTPAKEKKKKKCYRKKYLGWGKKKTAKQPKVLKLFLLPLLSKENA